MTNLKIFKVRAKWNKEVRPEVSYVDFLVAAEDRASVWEQVRRDHRLLMTVMDPYYWDEDGRAIVLHAEDARFDLKKEVDYTIPLLGGACYSGKAPLQKALEEMADPDEDCALRVRRIHFDGETAYFYSEFYNESAARAIRECEREGIDPYGH